MTIKPTFFILAMLAAALALAACGGQPAAPGGAGAPPDEPEPYAPEIDPANFVDEIDNPYWPLVPGTTFIYEGETEDGFEHIEVYVTHETREVMGVTCTVVLDTVWIDGEMEEETYDWYAQDADGNVWYFGEEVSNYQNGELVNHAGAWEAGVDGALPGVVMWAAPAVGQVYRQEYYEGEAEDMAEVISLDESEAVPYGSFDGLLMTEEWTPLEPGVVERKVYAPGIGLLVEYVVEGGSGRIELVDITTE